MTASLIAVNRMGSLSNEIPSGLTASLIALAIAAGIFLSVLCYWGASPLFIGYGVAMAGIGMLTLTGTGGIGELIAASSPTDPGCTGGFVDPIGPQ